MQRWHQVAGEGFVQRAASLRFTNDVEAIPAGDVHTGGVFAQGQGERAADQAGAENCDARDEVTGRHGSGDATADGGGDDAEFAHELRELAGLERLRAVGERVVGIVVDFDEEAISAGGNRGAGHWRHFVAAAGAVRRIGNHGQVGKFFDDGNGCDVESVAGVGFERANAALAENDVVVAAGEDVFGAHEKFFHGGGHAALEKNGLADFAQRAKEVVVLHVARADLEDVDVTHHHLNLRRVHHFADGKEAEFVGGLAHKLEARFTHALEGVGRSARLEGAGAQDFCASFCDAFSDGVDLLAGFHRAGTSGNDDLRAADFDAAAEIDDGAFGLELAAGEFERLGNAHDFAHAVEQFEVAMIEVAVNADGAEDGVRLAGGAVNVEAAANEPVDDMLDLGVGGPFLHHDDHESFLFPSSAAVKRKMAA